MSQYAFHQHNRNSQICTKSWYFNVDVTNAARQMSQTNNKVPVYAKSCQFIPAVKDLVFHGHIHLSETAKTQNDPSLYHICTMHKKNLEKSIKNNLNFCHLIAKQF